MLAANNNSPCQSPKKYFYGKNNSINYNILTIASECTKSGLSGVLPSTGICVFSSLKTVIIYLSQNFIL